MTLSVFYRQNTGDLAVDEMIISSMGISNYLSVFNLVVTYQHVGFDSGECVDRGNTENV